MHLKELNPEKTMIIITSGINFNPDVLFKNKFFFIISKFGMSISEADDICTFLISKIKESNPDNIIIAASDRGYLPDISASIRACEKSYDCKINIYTWESDKRNEMQPLLSNQ